MRAIDLFSGAGGFSTGARMAGLDVVWAANHWQDAVATHAVNHPDTDHACQDLQQADWTRVPQHDVLLASPACQGHSRARGVDKPHHDNQRSTAWAVIGCAEIHRPKFVIVENVPEFVSWSLYPVWRMAMETMGYATSENIVNAADVGVPQRRKRAFLVFRQGKKPVDLQLTMKPHVGAETIVTFGLPGRSIASLKARTQERVVNGRARYGNRFLIAMYGNEQGGRDITKPLGTVTTNNKHALVEGDSFRMLNLEEIKKAMGFPADYKLPDQKTKAMKMLGNAVCPPVAKAVIEAAIA